MDLTPKDKNFRLKPERSATKFGIRADDAEYAIKMFPFLEKYVSNKKNGMVYFPGECVPYILEAQDDWIAKYDNEKWELNGIY